MNINEIKHSIRLDDFSLEWEFKTSFGDLVCVSETFKHENIKNNNNFYMKIESYDFIIKRKKYLLNIWNTSKHDGSMLLEYPKKINDKPFRSMKKAKLFAQQWYYNYLLDKSNE